MTDTAGGDGAATPVAPMVYAGVVGTLEEFDTKSELMAAYIERATVYMDANNVPLSKRAATLLSAIGRNTFHVVRNLLAPAKLHDQSLDDIVKALMDHFEPKLLVISSVFTSTSGYRDQTSRWRSTWLSYGDCPCTVSLERS